eukprot:g1839.t1
MEDIEEAEEDGEEGEIKGGFLGEAEMENRRTIGEAAKMSWVEAVLLSPGRADVTIGEDEDGDGDDAAAETEHGGEPPPPGTAADRPPPSAAATARLEAALVHKVTALLGAWSDDHDAEGRNGGAAETLVETLAEAAADGVDVARWLGHGRSSIRGRTPLMEAARLDRTGCCAVLAEAACAHGTGLNAGNDADGRNSALHYACSEGSGGRWRAARGRRRHTPAVIAKGFAANPNLMDAIRTAQEEEKRQKKRTIASELAAAAAAQYLSNNKRGERAGLGSTAEGGSSFAVGPDGRVSRWEMMRRRFSEAQSSGPGFGARAKGAGRGGTWLKGQAEGGGGEGGS